MKYETLTNKELIEEYERMVYLASASDFLRLTRELVVRFKKLLIVREKKTDNKICFPH